MTSAHLQARVDRADPAGERTGMAEPAAAAGVRRPSVLVIQRRLTHYRVPFFESLRRELAERGWTLRLAHGIGTAAEAVKKDAGTLPWAEPLDTRYLLDGRICWQPFAHAIRDASMVVVTPENKLLLNLPLQLGRRDVRVGLWGHGANLQGDPRSLRERFKRFTARRTDWWFGYTDLSVPLITRSGFPAERISVLDNTVDTQELQQQRAALTPDAIDRLRHELGLQSDAVGVYVGSLYAEKRIEFMLEAAQAIRERVPSFEFLIVGDGPQRALVEGFCQRHPWARYLGVRKGADKVACVALAKVMVNPGLVGLGILDAFVLATPMLTTDCGLHSPEIVYLEHGVNGVMTPNTVAAFADATAALLTDDAALATLRAGCAASAARYTIDNMARHFADGVVACATRPLFRR